MVAQGRGATAATRVLGAVGPRGGTDEWASVRERTGRMLGTPAVLLIGSFVLAFGLGVALIADEWEEGALVAGALVSLAVLAAVRESFKVWVALYPLAFLSPRFRLAEYADSGEKMAALQPWDVFALLVVVLALWRVWRTRRLGLPPALTVGLVLMLLFTLKGIRSGPDMVQSLKIGVRCLFEPMLVFAAIAGARWTRVELRRPVLILLLVGVITGVAALAEFAMGGPQGAKPSSSGRLASSWEGTNIQAAFLGSIIPVTIGVMFGGQPLGTVAVGASTFAVTALSVGLTMTRGVWLALAIVLTIIVTWLRAWLWAGLVAVLAVLVVLAAPPQFIDRLESITTFEEQRSATNRLELWSAVLPMVIDRPQGWGIDTWKVYYHRGAEYKAIHAHNVLLDMAFGLGVPAVLTFLGILAYVVLRAARTLYPWPGTPDAYLLLGLGTGTLCLIAAGLTDGSITMWPILAHTFWFLLALTWAATSIIREGEPGRWPAAAWSPAAD
jgi:O-antigen ligase